MYPRAFRYHRAASLEEAAQLLTQLGEDAKALAGGQSLIPLMKLRFSAPAHLVDLNFISGINFIEKQGNAVRMGALARHAELEHSAALSAIPLLRDCAAGIADVQVRNRGTIGGSVAEADPSGDWGAALLTQSAEVVCVGPKGQRKIPIAEFFLDAYTSALQPGELVREVVVQIPPPGSGGTYLALKRSAPVYASAAAAVQLTMDGQTCKTARVVLGCVGLTAIRATEAEAALVGQAVNEKAMARAVEAAMAAADPQPDMRGSVDYKRALIGALVKRGVEVAVRRSRGEAVEVSHTYA